MIPSITAILTMAAPLLFATLGALVSERAGVLAVFMDGAITLSGCLAIAFTLATGSPLAGFAAAAGCTVLFLFAVALFTERTGANPFLAGLSVNLFAAGLTSWLSSSLFGTRGVVDLASRGVAVAVPNMAVTSAAFGCAVLFALVFRFTTFGLRLGVAGTSARALSVRGIFPARYRVASWCIAAFMASCAGSALAFGLGAYVPNLSAGRGWTALAAVFLGYRRPLPCVAAVLLFTAAEYITNILQGIGGLPSTLILGLPYALALLVFVLVRPGAGRKPGIFR